MICIKYVLLLAILVCALPPRVSGTATTIVCDHSPVSNESTLVAESGNLISLISGCSMEYVKLTGLSAGGLFVISQSKVLPGGVLTVVFSSSPMSLILEWTEFQLDARLVAEGEMPYGSTIRITSTTFNIQTPTDGDSVAIDLRGVTAMLELATVALTNTTILIDANEATGLVAGIALTPFNVLLNSKFTLYSCRIVLNNSRVPSYGVYLSAKTANMNSITISFTSVSANGHPNGTAFAILLPVETQSAILINTFMEVNGNVINGIRTFLHVTALAIIRAHIYSNTHTHFGPTVNNLTVWGPDLYIVFDYNVFRTVYDPANPGSSRGNPTLIFSLPLVSNASTVRIRENELHASSFTTTPILFPGSTNLPASSSVYVYSNVFTTNSLSATLVPMTSFAISPFAPPRTIDLGTVYLCSNVWPPVFSVATTTTAPESSASPLTTTALPTRTGVAPPDALSEVVASADRPLNVSLSGGACPDYYDSATSRPNGSSASTSPTAPLLLALLACSWLWVAHYCTRGAV